ncbi:MAG: hypothetical protein PHE84_07375 [bacterium]|nr:hypothetical protein [bacterium]
MKLPSSVLENVRREFAADCREEIITLLSTVENSEKVLLYILKLAAGDKAKVREFVEEAKRDCRNIIFWVENPAEAKLDTPEKIDEFNKMLNKFGANFQIPKK